MVALAHEEEVEIGSKSARVRNVGSQSMIKSDNGSLGVHSNLRPTSKRQTASIQRERIPGETGQRDRTQTGGLTFSSTTSPSRSGKRSTKLTETTRRTTASLPGRSGNT